jgi:hypothetical protein
MEFSAISHWIFFTAIGGLGLLTFGPLLHTRFADNRLYQLGLYFIGALALVSSWYIFFWLMTALTG